MLRHKQTLVDPKKGDCFRTCVACILDREVESVPNFLEQYDGADFWKHFSEWLHGEGFAMIRLIPHDRDWHFQVEHLDGALAIASIPSLKYRGGTHAVVAQIQVTQHKDYHSPSLVLVHDPSPLDPPYPWFTKSDSIHVFVPRLAERLPTFTKSCEEGA